MNISELNFTGICRCCKLAGSSMLGIHDANIGDPRLPRIDEMLMAVASIKVRENDGMPSLMCAACINTLKIAFDFKKQLEQTDHELRTFLKSQKEVSNEITSFLNNLLDENLNQDVAENDSYSKDTKPIDIDEEQVTLKTEPSPGSDGDVEVGETNDAESDDDDKPIIKCNLCLKTFSTMKIYKHHRKYHHTANKIKTQSHQCKQCANEYTTPKSLRRHVARSHGNTKMYACSICQKTCTRSEHIKRHLYTHLKEKLLTCDRCNRGFNRQEHLSNHLESCNGSRIFSCDICNKGFTKEITLEVHKKMHANNEETQKYAVLTVNDLKYLEEFYTEITHIEEEKIIPDDNPMQVEFSEEDDSDDYKPRQKRKVSKKKSPKSKPTGRKRGRPRKVPKEASETEAAETFAAEHIEVHIQESDGDGHYECPICSRTFNRITLLESHGREYHVDYHILQCSQCELSFSRVYALKRHQQTHLVSAQEDIEDDKAKTNENKPFVCAICTLTFETSDELRTHNKASHTTCMVCCQMFETVKLLEEHRSESGHIPTDEEKQKLPIDGATPNKSKNKKFKCEKCTKCFSSEKYLQTHKLKHTNKKDSYVCPHCSKPFLTKSNLLEHVKFHGECSKKFLCSECGQRFIRKDYLIIHMRRHRGEKPFKCKFCGKGFPRATDLTVHERYHTGEKTHLCGVCGRGFGRAYNLTVHMRTHTGEKPYKCPYCESAFAQCNDLKSHVRRHTGERFQCDMCSETFLMGYALTNHKRSAHGMNIVSNIRRLRLAENDRLQAVDPPTTVPLPAPVIPATAPTWPASAI